MEAGLFSAKVCVERNAHNVNWMPCTRLHLVSDIYGNVRDYVYALHIVRPLVV